MMLRSANVSIASRPRAVSTGLQLQSGRSYAVRARGEWTDWFIRTDADGYESPNWYMRLAERYRRMPHARWFALVCCIGKPPAKGEAAGPHCHVTGSSSRITASASAELQCFANDMWTMYWNNRGQVTVEVEELLRESDGTERAPAID